jgi:L-amino acid N-acyltransferase YncA
MLTIRVARPHDAVAMAEVRREAILSTDGEHYPAPTVEAWVTDGASDRVARYVQQIDDPQLIVLIAEAGDDVIGFAVADPTREELRAIYVKRNSVGRVGQTLLSEVERRAFATADRLTVVASETAVEFYVENGYSDDGPARYLDSTGSFVPCRTMRKRKE